MTEGAFPSVRANAELWGAIASLTSVWLYFRGGIMASHVIGWRQVGNFGRQHLIVKSTRGPRMHCYRDLEIAPEQIYEFIGVLLPKCKHCEREERRIKRIEAKR